MIYLERLDECPQHDPDALSVSEKFYNACNATQTEHSCVQEFK